MSGYGGVDDEALHAMVLVDNAVGLARSQLPTGNGRERCLDCNDVIPEARRLAMKGTVYCVDCQEHNHDRRPQIRILDHIL